MSVGFQGDTCKHSFFKVYEKIKLTEQNCYNSIVSNPTKAVGKEKVKDVEEESCGGHVRRS